MIRVTVDLIPFGVESKRERLGIMTITNDGTGTHEIGNYNVRTNHGGKARIENWPRQEKGVTELVNEALSKLVEGKR